MFDRDIYQDLWSLELDINMSIKYGYIDNLMLLVTRYKELEEQLYD